MVNTDGGTPVPDRAAICVLQRVSDCEPAVCVPPRWEGIAPLIAQLEFAASWPLQLSDSVNGPLTAKLIRSAAGLRCWSG